MVFLVRWRAAYRLAVALGALFFSVAPAAAQQTVEIDVFNFDFGKLGPPPEHFDPTITVGDTVRWKFVDGAHSTTAAAGQLESWDSQVQFGGTFSHTFTKSGTFNYYCSLHGSDLGGGQVDGMKGQVIVQPVPEPAGVLLIAAVAIGLTARIRRRALVRRAATTTDRCAFSLIELLVVLSLLGVLLGLLLPAVQRTRASAGYLGCRNNLRQIALATHQHEAALGYFPGIGIAPHQDSALARLLPYLEQDALFRRIDPERPIFNPRGDYGWLDAAQAEASRTVVRVFLCPVDDRSPLFTGYDFATLAGTNYVANAGTGTGTYYDFRYRTDGVFWYGSRLGHADIVDGLSSTMFFAETLLGTGTDVYESHKIDPRRHWLSTACLAAPAAGRPGTNPPLSDHLCMSTMLGMAWRGDRAASWIGGPGHRTVFNTYRMPNDRMLNCGSYGLGWFQASSNHAGGVNMVLGDGSVHFIKDHIDLGTWRALSTRGDTEALGSYCGCH